MAEESISYIWGQQVTGDKPVVIKPSELPAFLVINRAVLTHGKEATLNIDISGSKYAIAKLRKDAKDQSTLDLRFWELSEEDEKESFELSVAPKDAKVDLTGYFNQDEGGAYSFEEEGEDSSDDLEGPYGPMTVEDITDAEAEKVIKAEEKKKPIKKQPSPAKPTVTTTDSQPAKQQPAAKKEKKGKQKTQKQGNTPTPAAETKTETQPAEKATPAAETQTETVQPASTESTTAGTEAAGKKRKADQTTPKGNKKQKNASANASGATTPTSTAGTTPTTTAGVTLKCPDCSKDFKGEKGLQAHAKAKHNK
eukprot:TRINITY_DN9699_c0_g1_i2.p1 TRINITY_DN9699_c0_g1~~TRINITY_DN9699_c0_g1_i2.p1  ORF type:complete len:310 (+),score=72.81 TRINITY_DN9699_c0_g1_i2:59-988(+)